MERTRIRELGLARSAGRRRGAARAQAQEQSPTEMMTALAVGGVGVGVMALIIVLSVMSGFEVDLQQKILGTNAHVVVLKYADPGRDARVPRGDGEDRRGARSRRPDPVHPEPGDGRLSEANMDGAIIKGIDPETVGQVTDLPKNILPGGDIRWLAHPEDIPVRTRYRVRSAAHRGRRATSSRCRSEAPVRSRSAARHPPRPGAGVEPARRGGRPGERRLPAGRRAGAARARCRRARPFRVAGIFYSGMFEYDSKFVYIAPDEAASASSASQGATGIELKVDDVDDARRIAATVLNTLEGYPYRTKDWGEMNRNLFSALRLEKLVMGIILSIIVIVAAGLIVATVIMLVLEKRKEISVLKALGVPDGGIVKIFLAEGLQIGVAGGLLGLFSGLAWCLFIEKVGHQARPGGLLHPLAAGEDRAAADRARGAHRDPGHLPRVHLPGAQGLARRAGRRAEGGVSPDGLPRDPRRLSKSYFLHGKRIDVLRGRVAGHRARRAGLAWSAPRARGRAPSSTCSARWTPRRPGRMRFDGRGRLRA